MLNNVNKTKGKYFQKGFTFIEVVIVVSIFATLLGISSFNLIGLEKKVSIESTISQLASDLKSQQTKAMIGESESGSSPESFGIYFFADQYVLFHGNSYNPTESTNFVVKLPTNVEIQSTSFPNNTIVFSALSGEILAFTKGFDTINLKTADGNEQSSLKFNRYGVIIQKD